MSKQIFSILNAADGIFGLGFRAVGGLVTGTLHGMGIINKPLKNVGAIGMIPHLAGRAVGKTGVTIAKPLNYLGFKIVKNTPKGAMSAGRSARAIGRGARKVFMKEAAEGEMHSLFGYKVRAGVPNMLALGAIGLGVAKGAGEADYNLGVKTAINGIMDTEGVAVVPGTINHSYTPVYNKPVNNYGATGELGLALHRQRNTGYL